LLGRKAYTRIRMDRSAARNSAHAYRTSTIARLGARASADCPN
jgi:hypothetical protein